MSLDEELSGVDVTTLSRDDIICLLRKHGKTLEEICSLTGIKGIGYVSQICKKHGVIFPEVRARELSEFERGYVSAFLDGEGSLWISKSGSAAHESYIPYISFSNTNLAVLERLQSIIGAGKIRLPHRNASHWGTKPVYALDIYVRNVIKTLLTQLELIIKKKQKDFMLEFINLSRGTGHAHTKEEMVRIVELHSLMKEAND